MASTVNRSASVSQENSVTVAVKGMSRGKGVTDAGGGPDTFHLLSEAGDSLSAENANRLELESGP